MKKFVYLCGMFMLNLNMMAQIDMNDPNWDTVFYDDFTTSRSWRPSDWYSIPDLLWRARPENHITHGDREGQIYQYDHCQFDINEGVVKLVSEFDATNKIPTHQYALPNGISYPTETDLYFFSGEIDIVSTTFKYGYFEIRCKLPLHRGSFPAFWLVGGGPSSYEEIDIFEYSKGDCEGDTLRGHSSGIWHNPASAGCFDTINGVTGKNYAKVHHHLPESSPDLGQYHTFGCEWMPDYVKWYRDGNLIAEYYDTNHIPQYPKTLKANYAILWEHALDLNAYLPLGWSGSDVMTIDYVTVYQLNTDCETDEYITTGTQFANHDNKMKRSITIGSPNGQVIVPSNTNVFMHAEESIIINGEFEISNGSQMSLSVHACPE